MQRGKYIVIEGLDGSGKTTQQQKVLDALKDRALGVREPGGTPLGEAIRAIAKDATIARTAKANALLFSAARAELTAQRIRPAIHKGLHVIADRNWLSTMAMQSIGGDISTKELLQLCQMATQEFFMPDLLVFIDTSVQVCQQRLALRAESQGDFFEQQGTAYFQKVDKAYKKHLSLFTHVAVIDGNQSVDNVFTALQIELRKMLKKHK